MSFTVTNGTTATFTPIAAICQGSTIPALPTTSNNGISGSWNPSAITATPGTHIYTFTPTSGQCAVGTTMSITVNSSATPTFTQIGPLCQGSLAPTLSTTSNNGIAGTWSPSTISTGSVGTRTYRFTPTAGCAASVTMTITISAQPVVPAVTGPSTVCTESTISLADTYSGGIWNTTNS